MILFYFQEFNKQKQVKQDVVCKTVRKLRDTLCVFPTEQKIYSDFDFTLSSYRHFPWNAVKYLACRITKGVAFLRYNSILRDLGFSTETVGNALDLKLKRISLSMSVQTY